MPAGVLALVLLAGCVRGHGGAGRPAAPLPEPAYAVLPVPADVGSRAAEEHAWLARARGVPALAGHTVPAGVRELRLSTGGPMVLGREWPLVRVVETAAGVTGEVWLARGAPGAPHGIAVRRTGAVPGIRWASVLAQVDSARLVPGPARRPPNAIMDGGELFLEVRTGGGYASQWYNAPHARARQDTAFSPAARVATLVDSLGRVAAGR